MRDPETLAKDIDRFTLETSIQRKVKYTAADIPALERENSADIERLAKLDADSPEAKYLRDETIRARTWKIEQLKKRKDSTITETRTEAVPSEKGIAALGAHIRATWTIREVISFKSFTHGGSFSAPGGGWRIDCTGYVAATADGMRNLVWLFDSLHAEAWAYMGAILYANMESGRHKATLMRDADDLMGKTLNALIKALPDKAGYGLKEAIIRLEQGVSFLVCDRKNRQKANRDRGKRNQAEGAGENASERRRAGRDIEKALARVHERVKKQGQQILAACRWVCAHFGTFTDAKKNAPTYLPLLKADGKPMKPETLARYYRKRYGSKQCEK